MCRSRYYFPIYRLIFNVEKYIYIYIYIYIYVLLFRAISYCLISCLETLRKYSLVSVITRKSSSYYTFRDTKMTIQKNRTFIISVYTIHHNPKMYPKPEVYHPERFSDEAIRKRDPMHYIPFEYGIRNCIAI